MVQRLMPNTNNLIVAAYGRTYTGTANTPYDNIPDQDAAILTANGWLRVDPIAAEDNPIPFVISNNLSEGVPATMRANLVLTGNLPGATSNVPAVAGTIGEFLSTSVASGGALALATGNARTIATCNITAGNWDISGVVVSKAADTTVIADLSASISATANTVGGVGNMGSQGPMTGNVALNVVTPPVRVSCAGNVSLQLVAQSNFSISTLSAYGLIRATRTS